MAGAFICTFIKECKCGPHLLLFVNIKVVFWVPTLRKTCYSLVFLVTVAYRTNMLAPYNVVGTPPPPAAVVTDNLVEQVNKVICECLCFMISELSIVCEI